MSHRFACTQGPCHYELATAGLDRLIADGPWIVYAHQDLGAPFAGGKPGFTILIQQRTGSRRQLLHILPDSRDIELYRALRQGDIIDLVITKRRATYYVEPTKIGSTSVLTVSRVAGPCLKEPFLAIEWDPEWAEEEYDELVAMIRELVKRQCGSDVRLIRAKDYTVLGEPKIGKEE